MALKHISFKDIFYSIVTNWIYVTNPAYAELWFWHGLYNIDLYEQFSKKAVLSN
jgi:hypothetical protein